MLTPPRSVSRGEKKQRAADCDPFKIQQVVGSLILLRLRQEVPSLFAASPQVRLLRTEAAPPPLSPPHPPPPTAEVFEHVASLYVSVITLEVKSHFLTRHLNTFRVNLGSALTGRVRLGSAEHRDLIKASGSGADMIPVCRKALVQYSGPG